MGTHREELSSVPGDRENKEVNRDSQVIEIREEQYSDQDAVRRINEIAFEQGPEAAIVDKLRTSCKEYCSFVAVNKDTVIGHIVFTPVTIDGSNLIGMGLAPMAVLPSYQKQGIGSSLVQHGLQHLQQSGCPFVIVLGHPEYYPRFDFEPASRYNLKCQWESVPDEAFMVIVFDRNVLPMEGGIARYRAEFDEAM